MRPPTIKDLHAAPFSNLQVTTDGSVVTVTLMRPRSHNALNTEVRAELIEVWQRVRRSPDVRCVVVTGGMNSFSAGRDLKETAAAYQDGAAGPEWEVQEMDIRPRASRVEIPVIAAIDGYCLGAGLLLAMDCDIRISSESATFGNPQVRVGRGTEVPLAMAQAGISLAFINDICLTGRFFDADEALRAGVVSRVVPAARLLGEAEAIARTIADGSETVVMGMLRGLRLGLPQMPAAVARELWKETTGMFGRTPDAERGAAAYVESRVVAPGET